MPGFVCVTGATGYVGAYVVKEALERGYRVRATVRDPADERRTKHLRDLGRGHDAGALELVRGDLEDAVSFERALAGVDAVIHTASAVVLTARDPQREIVEVAVEGARNVVRAAKASPTVRRVVLTSSVSAVTGEDKPSGYVFREGDWNDTATVKTDAYATSKVQAERAARALAAEPGGRSVELVAILPSLVLGPVMTEQHLRTSPAILVEIMKGKWPGVPDLVFSVVDVRDLARAHLLALEKESPAPRYLATSGSMGLRAMAAALREELPGSKVPRLPLPGLLMYATALFEPRLTFSFLRQNLGAAPVLDNTLIRRDLGMGFRPPRESVLDTGRSLVDGGWV
jgi:nucleoside-diphosphate-sugar epimerase